MNTAKVPVCLTIGTTDSSGGAGILGDVKAFASVGCFAAAVVVGVTAQNTRGIRARQAIDEAVIRAQIDAILDDVEIGAIKIGTTWSAALLRCLETALASVVAPIVFDPVMGTTAGASLSVDAEAARATVMERWLARATVITPNADEARALLQTEGATTNRVVAEELHARGARAVVVSAAAHDVDDWYTDDVRSAKLPGTRYAIDAEHGVGCAHSAILAGLLAQGWPVFDAAAAARARASAGVKRGLLHIGRGRHPVDVLGLTAHLTPHPDER